MTLQHPLRLSALLTLAAYVGGIVALLWRRPRAV
jgi:hypothetical protein